MIVDVDTHWEATSYASDEFPLAPWRDRLPGSLDMLAFGIAGDLLRALPADHRPTAMELLPNLVRLAEERGGPIILHPLHDSSPAERISWMDRIGIDHCLVNPGGYWQLLEFLGPDRPPGSAVCNDFLGRAAADGESDRLHPVAVVDFTDLDAAVERARARARRTAPGRSSSTTDDGRPPGGRRPATRRGIRRVVGRHSTSAWWPYPRRQHLRPTSPAGPTSAGTCRAAREWPALVRLRRRSATTSPKNLLSSLLFGGAFHRHPNLTVVLEEMGVDWVPSYVDMLRAPVEVVAR